MSPEELFARCAAMASVPMEPRSASDKEYFAQDWIALQLDELGWPYLISGRNTYPDFWVGEEGQPQRFGLEVKSLAFVKKPARKDFDTNSTIPGGEKEGSPIYTAFFLYTGIGSEPRLIHTLCMLHGDFLNAERDFTHENKAVKGFGSYGDAFIRDRKMYVFKTPFTILPDLIGKLTLVVPDGLALSPTTPALRLVTSVEREFVRERVKGYRMDLVRNVVRPAMEPAPRAGEILRFQVYSPVPGATSP